MADRFYSFPNRTLCDVLEEMRKADKTRNYAYMSSLIEEAQTLGNRMESALSDKRDMREWSELRNDMKHEIKALQKERDKLKRSVETIKLSNKEWDKFVDMLDNPPKPNSNLIKLMKETSDESDS